VGARFLAGAAEKGTRVDKTIARTVLEPFSKLKPFKNTNDSVMSSWQGAYHAVSQALISIATHGGAPLDAALIDLGLHVQDSYKKSMVNTLSKESGDPAIKAVAGALSEIFAFLPPSEDYRADLGHYALVELQKSTGLTTDTALVRNALNAFANTRLMVDKEHARVIIGTAFLKAMADCATMPENREAAREALDACTPHGIFDRIFHGKKDAEIAGIQSETLETILRNLKKAELEAELRHEMEKSVAERVLGGPEGEQAPPAAAVEEAERFIEVEGVRLSRKQWAYM